MYGHAPDYKRPSSKRARRHRELTASVIELKAQRDMLAFVLDLTRTRMHASIPASNPNLAKWLADVDYALAKIA